MRGGVGGVGTHLARLLHAPPVELIAPRSRLLGIVCMKAQLPLLPKPADDDLEAIDTHVGDAGLEGGAREELAV